MRRRVDRTRPPVCSAGPALGQTMGLALVVAMAVAVGVVAAAGDRQPAPATVPATPSPPTDGCPGSGPAHVPGGARVGEPIVGDLDGDDRPDRFLLYEPPITTSERNSGRELFGELPTRMRAELGTGIVVDVSSEVWWTGASPVGVVDVDQDGRDEVVIDPRDGATGFSVDLVAFNGCRPVLVTEPDGTFPVLYYYQNSNCCVGEVVGVECADVDGDSRIEVVTVDEKPSGEWSFDAYRLEDGHLVPSASGRGIGLDRRPANLHFSGGFHCHGFNYN